MSLLSPFKRLQSLSLLLTPTEKDLDSLTEMLHSLSYLSSLNLRLLQFSPHKISRLLIIPSLPNLTSLSIENIAFTTLRKIKPLDGLFNIKTLDVPVDIFWDDLEISCFLP